jgi:MraZ protein
MSMDRFVANCTSRLDAKGRVSIPAAFRTVLSRDGFEGLYCYPSLDQPAIDAGGHALLAEIEGLIARFAPYSEQREELLIALYGRSETLKIDSEGRVVLTDMLKSHAGIGEAATFVGLGQRFQIWEPERFRAYLEKATAAVRELTKRLGSERIAPGDGARE